MKVDVCRHTKHQFMNHQSLWFQGISLQLFDMRGLHPTSTVNCEMLSSWNLQQLPIEIYGNSPLLMVHTEVKSQLCKELPKRTCLWPSIKLHSWVPCDSFPMVYLACQVNSLRLTTLPSWNLLQTQKLTAGTCAQAVQPCCGHPWTLAHDVTTSTSCMVICMSELMCIQCSVTFPSLARCAQC